MAGTGIEFHHAAEASMIAEDEDVLTVTIDGIEYTARKPTVAFAAIFASARGTQSIPLIFRLIEGLMGPQARDHIEDLMFRRVIDIDDLIGPGTENNPGERGLLDRIYAHFRTGRPTQPSADS